MSHCFSMGISSASLLGEMSDSERQQIYSTLKVSTCPFKVLYVTPETEICDKVSHSIIQSFFSRGDIQRFVIDEVHCVVEWGTTFWPAYLNLKLNNSDFPKEPMLMLTTTATEAAINEVKKGFGAQRCKSNFYRSNLFYSVQQKSSKTIDCIVDIVKELLIGLLEHPKMTVKICLQNSKHMELNQWLTTVLCQNSYVLLLGKNG